MDLTSPRQRKRWDALSPPKIAVLELAEDEPACMETHDSAALSHSVASLSHSAPRATATHIPPLGLGRMRSSDGLVSALSARERGSACTASEHGRLPLTARPLGVTPRNAAMLGPRTDAMIRDVEFGWPARSKVAQATKGDFTQAPRRSDAAARRGESHPHLLSRRAATAPASDWAQIAPSDPHAWLQEALGCVVEIPAEGVRATLLGASEGLWAVVPQGSGAPARLLPGASLRRVAPSKGEMSRTVVGSAVGFQGEAVSHQQYRFIWCAQVALLLADSLPTLLHRRGAQRREERGDRPRWRARWLTRRTRARPAARHAVHGHVHIVSSSRRLMC